MCFSPPKPNNSGALSCLEALLFLEEFVLLVGGLAVCNSGHGEHVSSCTPFLAPGGSMGPAHPCSHECTQASGSVNTSWGAVHCYKLWASSQGRCYCLLLYRAVGSSPEGQKGTEVFQHGFIFFVSQCCLLSCQRKKNHILARR